MPVTALKPLSRSTVQPLPPVPASQPSARTGRKYSRLLTGDPAVVTSMCQMLNIRYEVSDRSGHLLNLYWEGRQVSGYQTIEEFYADMKTDGWQVESISRPRSHAQLHFAVMKRLL